MYLDNNNDFFFIQENIFALEMAGQICEPALQYFFRFPRGFAGAVNVVILREFPANFVHLHAD